MPWEVIEYNKMVTLTTVTMFVNQIHFIITDVRGVGLTTVEWISNRLGQQFADNIKKVLQLYCRVCFTVQTILMDMEFKKLKPLLSMVNINTGAPNEHGWSEAKNSNSEGAMPRYNDHIAVLIFPTAKNH